MTKYHTNLLIFDYKMVHMNTSVYNLPYEPSWEVFRKPDTIKLTFVRTPEESMKMDLQLLVLQNMINIIH